MAGDIDAFHTPEIESHMISAMCAAGAVDGFSAGPTLEVDGADWHFHAAFVRMLRTVVGLALDHTIPDRHRFGDLT
jgi:hypothetical protein